MKIVHLGKYYFPERGGIESVTQSLAEGAYLNKFAVSVVCFSNTLKSNSEIISGVRVFRCRSLFNLFSQPFSFRYFYLSFQEIRGSDIVHLHLPNMLALSCCLLFCKNRKIVVHWHSDVIKNRILSSFLYPLQKSILNLANAIIATSPIYSKSSALLSSFIDKTYVIPIGIPDRSIVSSNEKNKIHNFLSQHEGKRIILSVGRLVPYKGFEYLIKAAKFIDNDALILIVGSGPLEQKLIELVQLMGLSDKVILMGPLSDSDLRVLFQSAYIFCLPSINRAEAFGVVLLEAMAFGLPIVTTNILGSGVSWVNIHQETGINVEVMDSQGIAVACNEIIRNKALHSQFSASSRRRFLDCFTEKIFVEKVLNLYSSIQN